MKPIESFCVSLGSAIREAMRCIDRTARGIALVVDEDRRLLGTVTDGDIRRAILAGTSLDLSVAVLLETKAVSPYPRPVSAPRGTTPHELLRTMQERKIRQLPLLDPDGRVVDLAILDDLLPGENLAVNAVIMAGGFGKRLRPLTDEIPKPMLPVGDRPLLERIVDQLRNAGIHTVNITTHYRPEVIMDYFGDGTAHGMEISYVREDRPLGTAGALGLLDKPQQPLLVMNGDILTRVDVRAMLRYHRRHGAEMTIAVGQYDITVPYGVIECDGSRVTGLREKPALNFFVNAGIYLLEPVVHQLIPAGERFDMTDLIERLLKEKRVVVNFPIVEYWLDVGQHADYQKAQDDLEKRDADS